MYVVLLGFILQFFNIQIAAEELTQFIEAIVMAVGLAMAWWGRYRKGDLTIVGARK